MEDTRMTRAPEGEGEEWLSLAEALEFLGISKQTLYRLLERGDLKGTKVGRQWRFARADLRAYLERGPEAAALATVSLDAIAEGLSAAEEALRAVGAEVPVGATDAPDARVALLAARVMRLGLHLGASDIHLEPERDGLVVRVRVDGRLREALRLARPVGAALVTHLKAMSELSLEERRLPQDGRIHLRDLEHDFDLRVSTIPALYGESLVMRILAQDVQIMHLDEVMAHTPDQLARLRTVFARQHGTVICTGPAGSGKTTTLYAALMELGKPEVKVVTIEDPVEYTFRGMVQVAVNMKAGLTFPRALRAILRQDPDVIMVGEVRDLETLQITAQAALTGHLVLTTMPTSGAAETLTQMVAMGLEPYLVAGATSAVLAQQLARSICPDCREAVAPPAEALARLGMAGMDGTFYRAAGCPRCRNTGYRGRLPLHELLVMDETLAALLARGATTSELAAAAEAAGMVPMVRDGVTKAAAGLTTVEEVLRVTALR